MRLTLSLFLFFSGCSLTTYSTKAECEKSCNYCRKTITNRYQCRDFQDFNQDDIVEYGSEYNFQNKEYNK